MIDRESLTFVKSLLTSSFDKFFSYCLYIHTDWFSDYESSYHISETCIKFTLQFTPHRRYFTLRPTDSNRWLSIWAHRCHCQVHGWPWNL